MFDSPSLERGKREICKGMVQYGGQEYYLISSKLAIGRSLSLSHPFFLPPPKNGNILHIH